MFRQHIRYHFLVWLFICGLQPPVAIAEKSAVNPPDAHPNILLIVVDTLRADHLTPYGYRRDTSRSIAELAKQSHVFLKAISQAPCTDPSMWSIIRSRYQPQLKQSPDIPSIPRFLKSKNYATGAFIAQHLLENPEDLLSDGFDVYDAKWEKDLHDFTDRRAASVTDSAIKWIKKNRSTPFFAWLTYFDPHDPYEPPEPFRQHFTTNHTFSRDRRSDRVHLNEVRVRKTKITNSHRQFLIDAYDEEIRYVDGQIGRLLEYLKSEEVFDNTLIVLTSDHGEELGENGDRWDHCMMLSLEEIHVPLIVKLPGASKRQDVQQPVQTIDIFPTIVDFVSASQNISYNSSLEGVSFLSLMNGEAVKQERFALSIWRNQRSVVFEDFHYWVRPKGGAYLYQFDTGRKVDDPAAITRAKTLLGKLTEKMSIEGDVHKKNVERLKSLGYL